MITEKIEVSFRLFIGGELKLNEQEINANLDTYRSKILERNLSDFRNYDGAIIISYPGQPIVEAEDELPDIVISLCFWTMPELIANKDTIVEYSNHYGNINLNNESSNIIISGDDIPTIRVPRSELLPALYECGQRFIQFLINLKGEAEDNELENLICILKDQGEIARKALESIKSLEHENHKDDTLNP